MAGRQEANTDRRLEQLLAHVTDEYHEAKRTGAYFGTQTFVVTWHANQPVGIIVKQERSHRIDG